MGTVAMWTHGINVQFENPEVVLTFGVLDGEQIFIYPLVWQLGRT